MTDEDVRDYIKKNSTIDSKTKCWNWNFSCDQSGYARCHLRRYPKVPDYALKVSRVSYLVFNGEIKNGLMVLHHCDNRRCVNPDHLHMGTHQDNMDEMSARGRQRSTREFGNCYAARPVLAAGILYESCVDAGKALGITDNGIRKRIKLGWTGYEAY